MLWRRLGKPFTSKTKPKDLKENDMVIIELGWGNSYVMSVDDAFKIAEILGRAERYEDKYNSETKTTTHHVFPSKTMPSMKIMSDALYQMAKLAGEPGSA